MVSKKTALFLSLFCSSQFYSVSTFANDEYQIDDLGTLNSDNSGSSSVGIMRSLNGQFVVGSASNGASTNAFIYDITSGEMTLIGTLNPDNTGSSFALASSSDGKVVTGAASYDDSYDLHAFRYSNGVMTDLGTLTEDNKGTSFGYFISDDGRVISGDAAVGDGSYYHAFRHNEGDEKMTDLGSLKEDNTGTSSATGMSADGRVIVGSAVNEASSREAYRHNEGDEKMTGLGTLKADNTGYSFATAVSADGRVVVGYSETDQLRSSQAFRHNEGDEKMTGLGTLKADNTGSSEATAVSADGRVVVGSSDAEVFIDGYEEWGWVEKQAFRHNEGDEKMTGLGSLTSDNTGRSEATAVSADGRVVVGKAETDSGYNQAFRHNEGDEKMTALGTLRSDNSGTSSATGVSADGNIVIGTAQNNQNQNRAVIWKTEKAVDLENTIDSMIKSTDKAQQVLGVYEGQLFSLADRNCNLSADKDYCLGIYTNYNNVKDSDLYASGLIGAMRIANTGWTVGGAVNFNLSDNLVDGYKAHGFELPGVGAFVRYNENKDGTGFNSELKGSYLKQKMTITREALDGAEHGEGETKLSGYLVDLGFGYGIQSDKWLVTPKVNLRHHEITRDGYAENRNADFLASYEEMGNKNTNLALAVNTQYALSPKVNLEAEFGSYMTLKNDQKDAVVKIDYIGEYSAKKSYEQASFRPFVKLSSSYAVSPNSSVGVNASWHKTTYKQDFTQAGLMYSYSW